MGTRLEESQPNGLGFRGEIIIKVNRNFENEQNTAIFFTTEFYNVVPEFVQRCLKLNSIGSGPSNPLLHEQHVARQCPS